jgi:hypothetical protein
VDIIDLAEENEINEEFAEILLFSFIKSRSLENELSTFIKEKIKSINLESKKESLKKSDFKSFTHAFTMRGSYNTTYEFQSLEDANLFLKDEYPKYKEKYSNITYSILDLEIFKFNDHCNVHGEGTDKFKIIGINKYSEYSYGYILNNGFVEPVHKCHRLFLKK